MTAGIRYLSYADHSGYSLAALGYVRALRNAGIPVWWTPLLFPGGRPTPWRPEDGLDALPFTRAAGDDAALADLPTLVTAGGACAYDTVIVHTVPEHWPALVEPGKRNVGCTVWEVDALPAHWPALLNLVDRVLVPCEMNRALFGEGGVTPPVRAVPHARRHAWNVLSSTAGAGLRAALDVPADHFVFYSINVWDPRKALADLVRVFSRTFGGDEKVTLVLKTSTLMSPHGLERTAIPARVRALQDEVTAETGRAPATIRTLAADSVPGRLIDALHATGDCFVSLTHGEGWGMGSFDAATLGKPVLIAPYGGPADFLPADYPGFIDYTMVPVSGWVESASFRAPQRWAQPDLADAGRRMRDVFANLRNYLDSAAVAAERIHNRYAEPVVAREMIAALDG